MTRCWTVRGAETTACVPQRGDIGWTPPGRRGGAGERQARAARRRNPGFCHHPGLNLRRNCSPAGKGPYDSL